VTAAEEWDYIVVGAGSGGCALAYQLSRHTDGTVLVLEAGGNDDDPRIGDPAACYSLLGGEHDWSYRTVPQAATAGRVHTWPAGRVLGGSSSVNGMAYFRGCRDDYDGWAAGGAGPWDASAVWSAFGEIECGPSEPSDAPGTVSARPLPLSVPADLTPAATAFLDACTRLGYPRNDRLYLGDLSGAGSPAWTIRDGRRQSAARAFLRPALATGQVTVRSGAEATRLVCDRGRVRGVELAGGGPGPLAIRQVVLCGGAVGSAALLLRSGIGPAGALRDRGIQVVADLPGVGQGLHDHVMASVVCEVGDTSAADQVLCQACLFVPGDGGVAPAIQLSLVEGPVFAGHALVRPDRRYITILAGLSRPRSRGSIQVVGADPAQPPLIDPGYLRDGDDLELLAEGLRLARAVAAAMHQAGLPVTEVLPASGARSGQEVRDYIRAVAATCYHPVGSCAMGTGAMAVVDPWLACRAVDGLSVADASVMPSIVSANTNAAAMMIGWRGGEMIAART
jgi:choline dehydrogenase